MPDYKEKRKKLIDEAQALIDAGQDASAKMAEIKALDAQQEAAKTNAANLRALADAPVTFTDISDPGTAPEAGKADETGSVLENRETALRSGEYMTAWAKKIMDKPLNASEAKIYSLVNEYTHSTENTSILIPETVTKGIWEEIADLYPYWGDISKTYVSGTLTMIKEDTSTDAAWYDEDTEIEDGTETFTSYTLSGCELARSITVTWKLKEMAIDDFIPYITRRLSRKMGEALGYGVVQGQGQPSSTDTFKAEPLGIVTALKEDGNQVVAATALDYESLLNTRALVKSGYGAGLTIYANANTIWTGLAAIVDANERPIFYVDPVNGGGVGKVLGCTVKEDASFDDGQVLFSNASRGYSANINKDVTIATEDHVKARTTDYAAYAIVDGAPITLKAHALLEVASE